MIERYDTHTVKFSPSHTSPIHAHEVTECIHKPFARAIDFKLNSIPRPGTDLL